LLLEHPSVTFLGAPSVPAVEGSGADFGFVGVPCTTDYEGGGGLGPSAGAPNAVRAASLEFEYHRLLDHYDFDCGGVVMPAGVNLVDVGNVACASGDLHAAALDAAAVVNAIVGAGGIPLIVGGDDALPPMVGAGLDQQTGFHVLHVDAHLDFRDEVNGVRDGYSSPIRRLRELPQVGDIVQVGLRGIGSARLKEVKDALAAGNVIVPARELHAVGAGRILDSLSDSRPWLVTIDCDGLDPSVAPGVEWPEPDGVTYGEVATLVHGLAAQGRIAAIVFTEFSPRHDVRSLTALAVCRLLMNVVSLSPRTTRGNVSQVSAERVPDVAPPQQGV
jgi:agmatinase